MSTINTVKGNIVDVINKVIFKGEIRIADGKIESIEPKDVEENSYVLPGLIDSHIHIESSMVAPSRFAHHAVRYGTVATVSDPHEISNVLGLKGLDFMIKDGENVPFKFYFGAPSCVPATTFESSGAKIGSFEINQLLERDDIKYLSEMMNFPGVIYDDPEVLKKLKSAYKYNKPVDGHAPGLSGEDLSKYIQAGISTDHECNTLEEAEEKIIKGMKVQIREGSAAKNYDSLSPLIDKYPGMIMLCSDDKHPDDLMKGHMNLLVKRSLEEGFDLFNILDAVCVTPVKHYKLDVGLLQKGDFADFIVVDNLNEFDIQKTVINGKVVWDGLQTEFDFPQINPENNFNARAIAIEDIQVRDQGKKVKCITAIDGDLYTNSEGISLNVNNGFLESSTDHDILKIVVLNRYKPNPPQVGFIKNFNLKKGAIASSIAHDSHNIIAVGVDDGSIVRAINCLIETKGGISVFDGESITNMELPIAGLMSNQGVEDVARAYELLDMTAKKLGSRLTSPFMTLSFMALLVIPELKIGDKGLFDVSQFNYTDLFISEDD